MENRPQGRGRAPGRGRAAGRAAGPGAQQAPQQARGPQQAPQPAQVPQVPQPAQVPQVPQQAQVPQQGQRPQVPQQARGPQQTLQARGPHGGGARGPPPGLAQQAYPQPQPGPQGDAGVACMTSQMQGLGIHSPPGPSVGRGSIRGGRELPCTIRSKPPKEAEAKKGSSGRPVKLMSNYFKVDTHTDWRLYQYRVDFKPEEENTMIKKALLRPHIRTLGGYIFDGSMLFSSIKYPKNPMELCSKRSSDNENIIITVRWVGDLERGDSHYIQFFNILTRKCLEHLKLQLVGRDYYDPKEKIELSKFKLQLWPGYMTSIRQHENSILLCAEISHKVMRRETVLNFFLECSQKNPGDFRRVFTSAIVGCIVLTEYNNHTYRIDDVDFSKNPSSTFDFRGQQKSYLHYYSEKYGLPITEPNQPLLISRPKPRDVRAGKTGDIVLIPELCRMTGLSNEMRSNFPLMKALADLTRVGPDSRVERLKKFSARLQNTPAIREDMTLWNMRFSPNLIELNARILDPESIRQLKRDRREIDRYSAGVEADWTKTLRNYSLLRGGELTNWSVVYDGRCKSPVEGFIKQLTAAMGNLGFHIRSPHYLEIRGDRSSDYIRAIEQTVADHAPQIILCIVPNNRAERYSAIKKKCCVDRPVPTQVVTVPKLDKGMSVATKIGIQMSCKIGGTPWDVDNPLKTAMVVGYDACHDAQSRSKSFGAMVASLDPSFSRYFSVVTHHSSGEELSNQIAINLIQAVQKYAQCNGGTRPSRIIFYRDGVGDGQIPFVLATEVEAILGQLSKVYDQEPPRLAFVIVSKRINTRFFMGKVNPPPGTVVDDVVTVPDKYDFFLVSQSVRQGTVSPTNYNVIYDSSGLTADQMQRFTYKMTHLYYNWSGTVRVPAQCQYAHKLAFLVGQSVHHPPHPSLNDLLYFL